MTKNVFKRCNAFLSFLSIGIGMLVFTQTIDANEIDLQILHTNDLHSHFTGNGPTSLFTLGLDNDPIKGHYARLATAIKNKKAELPNNTLILDAGDFFGGTLFHLLAPRSDLNINPEMDFFQHIGLDFTVLGNHEFDARDTGLATMLSKAKSAGATFRILSTNWKKDPKVPWAQYYDDLVLAKAVREMVIGGQKIKIGFMGILGPDALLVSRSNRHHSSFVGFNDKTNRPEFEELESLLAKTAIELRKEDKVQLVFLLAHAGEPEDDMITEALNKVQDGAPDIFIAGHTHQLYPGPKRIGRTLIVQAGEYGKFLGVLQFRYHPDRLHTPEGPLELKNGDKTFIAIDDLIESDQAVMKKIAEYEKILKGPLKNEIGFSPDEQVVTVTKDFDRGNRDNPELGKLVAGGIRTQLSANLNQQVDLYFTTLSLIREGLPLVGKETQYTFADVFRMLSIGIDEKMRPGTPIVHFYLSKWEIEMLINFMEIYSMFSKNFKPAFSENLQYEVRSWGIPMLNRLKNLTLNGKPYNEWPEYIHMATSDYIASYVDKVGSMSFGLVSFTAKDSAGKVMDGPFRTDEKEYQLFTEYLMSKKQLP